MQKIKKFLNLIGYKYNEIRVLTVLLNNGELSLRSLEKTTGLRQPEVSMIIKTLGDRGLTYKKQAFSGRRGRPEISVHIVEDAVKLLTDQCDSYIHDLKDARRELNALRLV